MKHFLTKKDCSKDEVHLQDKEGRCLSDLTCRQLEWTILVLNDGIGERMISGSTSPTGMRF